MANTYFSFKQFTIHQDRCAMKVGTDGVLLGAWTSIPEKGTILDVGTGTGLIALMLAQRSSCDITAVEIELQAYRQATQNVANSHWNNRLSVVHSSVQDFSAAHSPRFDLITSNPPFFSNSLKTPSSERTLARHNDQLPPEDLLTSVTRLLNPSGCFSLILPYAESAVFLVDAALYGMYCYRKTMVRSAAGKKPHRILLELGFIRQKAVEEELIIYTKPGEYTEAYKNLTNPFYLSF